ncbi:MAG: ATP-dependent Clp protease ATP-binding subunit [Acidobacteriaceae bacterium]|nr:ATP-dependent Clp protease ATP-binding subunit [Acidobacteriaceae bacterium]MBV9778464.1 ATP-dependent Clp protease ATP-binding subunit [Acidobacteriaceae bacterium]
MQSYSSAGLAKRPRVAEEPEGLSAKLKDLLVGQSEAIDTIIPFIQMHQAGLSPEGRPIGVILLLGPTGTGKTRTVEALAEVLHGNSKHLLRVDCGEFQMEHEVAKLVGAPPGYLGHRETQPMLTQAKLNSLTSETSDISLVLFDEIEKAAPSMTRLLLGILDKATLRLGDNTSVNFERTLIFLTSNLGAKAIQRTNTPDFGFEAMLPRPSIEDTRKVQSIGMGAVRRKFSPEFVNRIDSVITYKPLGRAACELILDQIFANFSELIRTRLGIRGFRLQCTPSGRDLLLENGTSVEFGARELKRTVQRNFIQPVSALVAQGQVPSGSTVILDAKAGEFNVLLRH